jgi:hypothetical protein
MLFQQDHTHPPVSPFPAIITKPVCLEELSEVCFALLKKIHYRVSYFSTTKVLLDNRLIFLCVYSFFLLLYMKKSMGLVFGCGII